MNIVKSILGKIALKLANSSSERRISYLCKQGGKIGENTTILSGLECFGSEPYLVEVGKNCLISSNVSFITHDGSVRVINNLNIFKHKIDKIRPVKVGNNTFIGARVIVMPGVKIGNNCIIGAGSVVTKDIPDGICAAGVPAKPIMTTSEYAEKSKNNMKPYDHEEYNKNKKDYLLKYLD